MKAVVSKLLNVRSDEPKVLPYNNIGNKFFRPGDEIDITETVEGESYKGNSIWYKLSDGTYVWSGGVAYNAPDAKTSTWQFIPAKMNWVHDSANGGLGIVNFWNQLQTRGNAASIAIFDTGISTNRTDFANIKMTGFRQVPHWDVTDGNGHGTNCASIAAATGNGLLFGIAPDADLHIYKCFARTSGQNITDFNTGLQDFNARNWPVDILSISFSCPDYDANAADTIAQLAKKYIILAALEHIDDVTKINDRQFPASLPDVIAVCAEDQQQKLLPASGLSNKPIWIFPGDALKCLDPLGNIMTNGQSSIATPLAAGVIALFIAFMRKNNKEVSPATYNKIIQFLLNNSDKVNDTSGNNISYIRLNASRALTNINQLLN